MLIATTLVALALFCAWEVFTDRRVRKYDEETWKGVHSLFVE